MSFRERLEIRCSALILPSSILLLTLSPILVAYSFDWFGIVDESFVLISTFSTIAILVIHPNRIYNINIIILILYICIVLVGLVGNTVSQFQENEFAIAGDILNCSKFFLAYLSGIVLIRNIGQSMPIIFMVAKVTIVVMFLLGIANLFMDTGIGITDARFGVQIRVLTFGTHPGILLPTVAALIMILSIDLSANWLYIGMGAVVCMLTMRAKGLGFAALVFLGILFYSGRWRKKNVFFPLIAVAVAFCIGWESIQFYFLNANASRALALRASVSIANDFAPFGSGFASFGTIWSTYPTYSSAYYEYGLSDRWGFMPVQGADSFVGDGGWASSIGQFGWLGFALILGVLALLAFKAFRLTEMKNTSILPFLLMFGYLAIAGVSDGVLFSSTSVNLGLALAVIFASKSSLPDYSTAVIRSSDNENCVEANGLPGKYYGKR